MPTKSIQVSKSLQCVDLFAGAGGFSLAAKEVGFSVTAAVEINKHACNTYRFNVIKSGATALYEGDILNIDPLELLRLHFSSGSECDLLLGGPPCQGFSVHRINGAGIADPRNKLILRYFEFVKALTPKFFLMENVPGILWPRHKSFLERFYKEARKSKYDVKAPITIDARDYGLPQRRKRVFILGTRPDLDMDIVWPPSPTHGDYTECAKDPNLLPWVPSSRVFNMPDIDDDENNVHMRHSENLRAVFEATPLNGGSRNQSGRILPCHVTHNGHTDVYGRIDPKAPAPTMTTACINPSKGRFVHPTKPHGITVRQAARFQTFPDWFKFKGGIIAAGEQIGNAVPVDLGKVLLSAIAASLKQGRTFPAQANLDD